MENLYALAVSGKMYYCLGKIDDSQIELVESIAKRLTNKKELSNNCEEFCSLVGENLNIVLTPISIKHVFRKI